MLDRIQAQGIAKKANLDSIMIAIEQAAYQGKDSIIYTVPFLENIDELKELHYTIRDTDKEDEYVISWEGY